MKGLIGRKVGMTQIFNAEGNRIPVTVVDVSGNVVVQKKDAAGADGYDAIKLGFGSVHKHEKEGKDAKWRISRPEAGVFLKAGIDAPRKHVKEVRVTPTELEGYEVGQELGAGVFAPGEFIDVTGTSKGRGFTGVMKRHNFHGAKATHGVHEFFRHGGSIGCSAYPARVFKGKKMAGHHGAARVTIQNLSVFGVMEDENAVLVKGAIPGPNGGIVLLRSAVKKIHN